MRPERAARLQARFLDQRADNLHDLTPTIPCAKFTLKVFVWLCALPEPALFTVMPVTLLFIDTATAFVVASWLILFTPLAKVDCPPPVLVAVQKLKPDAVLCEWPGLLCECPGSVTP